ncbi:MAG: riboflavin synthase [Deltaproteobacteria bacterium]|nr:riboflavin synthase [Deltaproteobacteria bacterium]MBW2415888.1 riboflavin synthase [Deltaproteobacteria bacterium]
MFTGIIEGVGTIDAIERQSERIDLRVRVGVLAEGVSVGDSVALNGCCLTVTAIAGQTLAFQAVPETLALTSIGDRKPGDHLNVERAMRADARLDGHIVQGHVDGTGTVSSVSRQGEDVRIEVGCDESFGDLLVPKGSVALDGVSLTVVDPRPRSFAVALIPHTLAATTLGERVEGDRVNLEADVLGKYVRHYLERISPGG